MFSVWLAFIIKLCFFYLTTCIVFVTGEYFTKSIFINKKTYEILGSRLSIDGSLVDLYSSIPYAKPPINDLRFKHPQEFEGDPWTGVYNSTKQPNTCWQAEAGEFDKLNLATNLWLSKTPMNEDCLYLTIWSPKTTQNKLSVMVWIYGGSFSSGSSTLEVYDGSILAAKHEVVVVSLQYRLGPLGFLYLDDNQSPGNQGLMDQKMALKWIKDNIHNFNGDQDKITVFGESAGSGSVSFHVLSPMSQIFFNRAIMQSGSALAPWAIETKEKGKEKSLMLAQLVDCRIIFEQIDRIIRCLRNVKPEILVTKQFDLKSIYATQRTSLLKERGETNLKTDAAYFIDIYFKPIYDGYFIPRSIDNLINDSNSRTKMEFLMGSNANEGMFFLLYGLNKWLKFFNKDQIQDTMLLSSDHPNYTKVSNFLLENLATNDIAHRKLLPLLLYEYNIPSDLIGWKRWSSKQVLSALDQLVGDQNFVCPVIDFAEILSEKRNVYLYEFIHRTEGVTFPKWVGTMHGYEIEYIFGMPFSDKFQSRFYSFTSEEKILSQNIMKMFTDFAKYGNPTVQKMDFFGKHVTWPLYNTTDKFTFFFTTPKDTSSPNVRPNEKSRKCKFWNKVLPPITSLFNKGTNILPLKHLIWINIIILLQYLWIFDDLI